ncbi:PREDICTED: uncharacterized protein LOC106815671 [Priapulus caudatus]|uniref:Uncharacterized protein LOC106815671 n=1 Tax=Priapulus caudatus TaxID=37621 RepID=A0ABM1ETY3_PRICU|nr:PREDICTED: uncharacterized protein LOC106815671 [Priapulus caudatus]XP_014675655.1 PREDICTED: uncharacterized protein LOC106815671 [Priapulus caudatus]XP_014675656.1 PREDICTED: uncharacterized protein LOC106815671 [Priapulus caudatus]
MMHGRKNNILAVLFIATVIVFISTLFMGNHEVLPLGSVDKEGIRLTSVLGSIQYKCKNPVPVKTRSGVAWVICTDQSDLFRRNDSGTSHEGPVMFSVGTNDDVAVEEKFLNDGSAHVYVITPNALPDQLTGREYVRHIQTLIVPNDPNDFGKFMENRQTLNSLLKGFPRSKLNLLKLDIPNRHKDELNLSDLLHYMILDGVLGGVEQLMFTLDLAGLNEDQLFDWYKLLHQLFHKADFRLFSVRVSSAGVQAYNLSWVKQPKGHPFIMQPPAGYGTSMEERERLENFLAEPQVACGKENEMGGVRVIPVSTDLTNVKRETYSVCLSSKYGVAPPCVVYSLGEEQSFIEAIEATGCSVFKLVQHDLQNDKMGNSSHWHHIVGFPRSGGKQRWQKQQAQDVSGHQRPSVALVKVHGPLLQLWPLLSRILDSGLLEDVHQVAHTVPVYSVEKNLMRRQHYSELKRLQEYGFSLFHTESQPQFSKPGYQLYQLSWIRNAGAV